MSKRKSGHSDTPRLLGIVLMVIGIGYMIFFILLTLLFDLTGRWDPLPILFFLFIFALGLMLFTNSIGVKPSDPWPGLCPVCFHSFVKDEHNKQWYCSNCKKKYESYIRLLQGKSTNGLCPMCEKPLAYDVKRKIWFCHPCYKRYVSEMLDELR